MLVIPQFKVIFKDMGGWYLPAPTRLLLTMSDNVIPFWMGVGVLIVVIGILAVSLSGFSGGRRFKEIIYFRIPVLGRVYHRSLLCRLADAMGLLVGAGCDMPNCLRLSAGATGSETIKSECEAVARQLEQGQNIVEAGQLCSAIPALFFYSMQLGYQRNELQDNLFSLSDMYAHQTRTNQSRLQAILLPLMLVVVGGAIGFMVMAIFLPLPTMISAASGSAR